MKNVSTDFGGGVTWSKEYEAISSQSSTELGGDTHTKTGSARRTVPRFPTIAGKFSETSPGGSPRGSFSDGLLLGLCFALENALTPITELYLINLNCFAVYKKRKPA